MKIKKLNLKKLDLAIKAKSREERSGQGKLLNLSSLTPEELAKLANVIASKIKLRFFYNLSSSDVKDVAGEIACYVLEEKAAGLDSIPLSKLFSRGIREARRLSSLLALEDQSQLSKYEAPTTQRWWDAYDVGGFINSIPPEHRPIIKDVLIAVLDDGLELNQAFYFVSAKHHYTPKYVSFLFYKYKHKQNKKVKK